MVPPVRDGKSEQFAHVIPDAQASLVRDGQVGLGDRAEQGVVRRITSSSGG
jgi:hypothetical protein